MRFSDPTGHKPACGPYGEECSEEELDAITFDNGSPINDPDWGDKDREERAQMVWDAICEAGGWWGSGCPTEEQLVSWLVFEEGGTLNYQDQVNMARGVRYKFAYFGNTPETFIVQLSSYTAFFNPDGDGDFDQSDWDTLTNPSYNFEGSKTMVAKIYKTPIKASDGNYMYWWDENEIKTDRSKWPGKKGEDYFPTTDVKGLPFYFTGIPNIQYCAMNGTNCK